MGRVQVIEKDSFFVISDKGEEECFFFNPVSRSCEKQEFVSKQKINNKIVMKYSSIADGFYIVYNKYKMKVIKKGDFPNLIFLRTKNNSSNNINADIFYVDGTSSNITLNRIIDNIYVSKNIQEDRPGWITIEGKTVGYINSLIPKDNNCILTTETGDSSVVKSSKISSSIDNPEIASSLQEKKINSSVSSSTISSST